MNTREQGRADPNAADSTDTCKRKEEQHHQQPVPQQQQPSGKNPNTPKKPRLVFTDLQRRTLQAIFKETKRPSKEMQITISQQLGLELSTVGNFFMNARRRSQDKWQDEDNKSRSKYESTNSSSSSSTTSSTTALNNNNHHHHHNGHHHSLIGGGVNNLHPSTNHHLLSSPLLSVGSNPSVATTA